MRRTGREIRDNETIFQILKKSYCCRFGLIDEGKVYIVLLNFGEVIHEDHIILYFHSAKDGRKIELIKKTERFVDLRRAICMIFNFDPWQLDIDVNLTKQLYQEADYSTDKTANIEFIESLSSEQQLFFYSLGVDLDKIEIDKMIYEILEDEETSVSKIYRMSVNFLMKGKILTLPKYQKDIYSDDEVFGNNFPKSIKVLSSDDEDYLKTFDNGIGAGIVFKHPCFHYENEKFKNWDCGYILGTILIMKEIEVRSFGGKKNEKL